MGKSKQLSKAQLKQRLLTALSAELATARQAHAAAIVGATHSEAKAENSKDTRGLEQSYLARGLAERVAELETACLQVQAMATQPTGDAVVSGAIVELRNEDDESELTVWVSRFGGGTTLEGGVRVISPTAPLGSALLGNRAGDTVEMQTGGKRVEWTIVTVR